MICPRGLLQASLLLLMGATAQAGAPVVDWDAFGLPKPEAMAARSAAGTAAVSLHGFLSVWSQECAGSTCSLPSPVVKNDPAAIDLGLPAKAGEFQSAVFARSYQVDGKALNVKSSFYALCPPGKGCGARYFQVQVELSGAAAAFCSVAVNEGDISPFPVVSCGAPQGEKRIGITLHREKLP